ncbi:MAG: flagellar hook-basal body complex protein FliE [Gemmatales bacterium]|nr:flagellar hook-basal body complex protein FliE [Gemmatales bacterium]MDW7995828.1 flagellar hook-basal body complex protein FliE [Gemmatales bacterium]
MSITPIREIAPALLPGASSPTKAPGSGTFPFSRAVHELLQQVQVSAAQANQAVHQLALGQAESLHDVLLSVAQADLTFRLLLEIRNRLTEAYQEIARMPI